MNYHCPPDIDLAKPLTPQAVILFERFGQTRDRSTVDGAVAGEVRKHVKVCELAILHYACMGYSWAELPEHPISDITNRAFIQLAEQGWKVEVDTFLRSGEYSVSQRSDQKKKATRVIDRYTVSWLTPGAKFPGKLAKEWDRRERLEEAQIAKTKWNPISQVSDGVITTSTCAWSTIVDGKFLAEVQRHLRRNYLCLFDLKTRACLMHERTQVSFGAGFGPDVGDVDEWQQRVTEFLAARNGGG